MRPGEPVEREIDPVTTLTMERFYGAWLGGRGRVTIGSALAKAQQWLRAVPSGPALREYVLADEFMSRLGTKTDRNVFRAWANFQAELHPNSQPFASPAYWAPFVTSGLSYAPAPAESR